MSRYDAAVADFNWLLQSAVPLQSVLSQGAHPDLDAGTAASLLTAAGEFITGVIAPINEASDRVGFTLKEGRVVAPPGWQSAYREWCDNGWPGFTAPPAHGGQGMPFMLQACVASMLGGADLGFSMVAAAGRAAGSVLLEHAGHDLAAICVPKLASGEWGATIAMTEAQAGTDVGLIRTVARPLADGRFAITGTKIFISGGDHDLTPQILHILLARIEGAPSGVKGLSLFMVPSRRLDAHGNAVEPNGVTALRLEEKMGLHGSPTCVLDFNAAEGVLLGKECGGLAAMFTMMHELRLETALSASGLAVSATAHAMAYAEERRQGRTSTEEGPVPLSAHPDVARMLSMMRALSEGGRALFLDCARHIDLSRCARDPAARQRSAERVALMLPVCKAGVSDDAVEVANIGIQIRGGHGYIRESGAEQFLRDVRVLPLYEGANGIQAIDLVMRKVVRDQGASLNELLADMSADLQASASDAGVERIRRMLGHGIDVVTRTSQSLIEAARGDDVAVLAGASAYLALLHRVCLAWLWLRMATAEGGQHKRELAVFYAEYYAPELDMLAARALRRISTAP